MSRDVRLGVVYSDNVNLVPDNEVRSVIGSVRPRILLDGTGLNSSVSAQLDVEYLADVEQDTETVSPSLSLAGQTTPGAGPVTFDGSARFYEVAAQGRQTAGNVVNNLDNLTSASEFGVGATFTQDVSPLARFIARYSIAEISVPDQAERDSSSRSAEVSLRRQQTRDRRDWGISASSRRNTAGENVFLNVRSVEVDGAVPISASLGISASAGREWVDQPESAQSLFEVEDEFDFWDVALNWRVGSNTSVVAGYGEHIFGYRPRFELEHTSRNSTFSLFWTRGITRTGTFIQPISTLDEDATPDNTDVDSVVLVGNGLIADENQFVIDEQVTLAWQLAGRVSSVSVEATRSLQERTTTTTSSDSAENRESRLWRFRFVFERQLTRALSMQADYQFTRQNSESTESLQFRENQIGLGLTFAF